MVIAPLNIGKCQGRAAAGRTGSSRAAVSGLLLRLGTPQAGQALCTKRSLKSYVEDLLKILTNTR